MPKPEKKVESLILDAAKAVVYGRGEVQYGHPRNDFECIASCWTAYLKKKGTLAPEATISERDVAMMMIQLKVARDANKPGLDNTIDIAGYAECAERVEPSKQG